MGGTTWDEGGSRSHPSSDQSHELELDESELDELELDELELDELELDELELDELELDELELRTAERTEPSLPADAARGHVEDSATIAPSITERIHPYILDA